MTITEVWEKYRHLDEVLTSELWLPDDHLGQITFDLWQAVKAAMSDRCTCVIYDENLATTPPTCRNCGKLPRDWTPWQNAHRPL